jgi:hypothetical protein
MQRALPALGVLAGGLVHSLLPLGLFGTHDRVIRALIIAVVSGGTAALIFLLTG